MKINKEFLPALIIVSGLVSLLKEIKVPSHESGPR